jgi:CubicO group peptidase (beta-lactamase class C family)
MTKSFVGLTVLRLRDQGRLSLDDPVARHLPELKHWRTYTRDAGPVTIRQLSSR